MRKQAVAVALILLLTLSLVGTALAVEGNNAGTTTFYVRAESAYASITLKSGRGSAKVDKYSAWGNYLYTEQKDLYGFYYVRITGPGQDTVINWAPSAFSQFSSKCERSANLILSFPQAGEYTVTIEPMNISEASDYWLWDKLAGWVTPASWSVTAESKCSASLYPQVKQGIITINYFKDGKYDQSETMVIDRSQYLSPKVISGYTCSTTFQYVYFNSTTGECYPNSINFYYTAEKKSGTVTIYIYKDGAWADTDKRTIDSSQYISPKSISGYTCSSSEQYVYLDTATGQCSPNAINFYYITEKKSATVTVHIYKDGSWADMETRTINSSQYIYPKTISGYTCSSESVYVSYNANGTCYPQTVSFYYVKKAAPVSSDHYTPPYEWDTKFKVGISEMNPEAYKKLNHLTDQNPNTYFEYYLYDSDKNNGYPDFTAFFNNSYVSGIKFRNGDKSNYERYMRVHYFYVMIYAEDKVYTENRMEIPDSYQYDYYTFNFQRIYQNVTKIEIYIDSRRVGQGYDKYLVRIRDIDFY